METLFIFNDAPYGSQRAYNGLRLAANLAQQAPIRVFLLGDGVTLALAGLVPVEADYNPQELLKQIAARDCPIAACGTCMEARGLMKTSLVEGAQKGTLDQLTQWTLEATRVLVF